MKKNTDNYKNLSDEKLMELVKKFNKMAFTEIYKRYSMKMLNYLYKMANYDRDKPEDMMQLLFMKILEKPHSFDTNRKFSTWLYSVASNICRNEYRKSDVEGRYKQGVTEESHIDNIEYDMDRDMFKVCLVEELKRMDFDHKTVFILRYREEMSIREIAEVTGTKAGTVKSRLFYTLKKLEKKLKIFDPKMN